MTIGREIHPVPSPFSESLANVGFRIPVSDGFVGILFSQLPPQTSQPCSVNFFFWGDIAYSGIAPPFPYHLC